MADAGSPTSTLGERGCLSMNNVSDKNGDELNVKPGQVVHQDCRKKYCDPRRRPLSAADKQSGMTSPRTRQCAEKFDFKSKCLFCATSAIYSKKHKPKRGRDVHPVMTLEFQASMKEVSRNRNDEWGDVVLGRLAYAYDLPAAEARYHQTCCSNFRSGYQIPKHFTSQIKSDADIADTCSEPKKGRPVHESAESAFQSVLTEFECNPIGQLTINDMVEQMTVLCGDLAYSSVHMKKRVLDHYGGNVIVSELNGKKNVVTYKSHAHELLHTFYHRTNKDDSEAEKLSIIKTAGQLIMDDIKSIDVCRENYPSSEDIMSMQANLDFVPGSLQLFLSEIIDTKDCGRTKASIGQAIVQAALPRSMTTPLQIGLGVQLHHQFGSKSLIETLHSLGYCSSYAEVQKFERNAAVSERPLLCDNKDQFVQFVGDNVDHNTGTIDGQNTFHGMGIIATITPRSNQKRVIPRKECTIDELVTLGKVAIPYYRQHDKDMELYYETLAIDTSDANGYDDELEFLLKISRPLRPKTPSWSGVMQSVQHGDYPGQSEVLFLPMIDMNPNDMSCIYSTLKYVAGIAERIKVTPIVTFDQPLFWKAYTIITKEAEGSDIKNTVVRLGGFHTEMSFLGCIGKLMDNTGLAELLATVYAPNTVGQMLSGKAVSRARRGHFLINDALEQLLVEQTFPDIYQNKDDGNSDQDQERVGHEGTRRQAVREMIDTVMDNQNLEIIKGNEIISTMRQNYEQTKQEAQVYRTAKLWLQYMDMVCILKHFITGERKGDWKCHIHAITNMLPYFAAAGHNLYLKSCHIYLQEMSKLEQKHPQVYEGFLNGNHIVRRSDRFWGGLSTDLIIEQVLMRSVKSVGGMTRGRGLSEAQRAQWLLSMPACAEINNAVQHFTGKLYETSDQHRESTKTMIDRDNRDRRTFTEFLRDRNPFTEERALRNIETGSIAENNVNVDTAKNVGYKIIRDMADKTVTEYSFRRVNQAVTLGTKRNAKVEGEEIEVDPQLLFQRIITVSENTADDIEQLFQYELCEYPASLFDSSGLMREANKPQLANTVWNTGECGVIDVPSGCTYVLDGGSLLQRIPWTYGASFGTICEHYCKYVQTHYGKAHIVFDGYSSGPSTKDGTRCRRTKGKVGTKICFNASYPFKAKKESFLTNIENKQNFIHLLGEYLSNAGCTVHNADEDADVLIIQTDVQVSEEQPTVVVGEDTDLLVLLCYHANDVYENIYFKSDSGVKLKKVWDIGATKRALGFDVCRLLPFVHAFSGCDTVSRIYGIGKAQVMKKATSDTYFQRISGAFLKESTHEEIQAAGEHIMVSLYNGNPDEDLDKLLYKKFVQKVVTNKSFLQIKSLPPTKTSTMYHSYRAYSQVQVWTGCRSSPLEWGWYRQNDKFTPIKCDLPAAPERLLKVVRCNCKVNCDTRRCTCRKHGLTCTVGCGDCRGIGCSNTHYFEENDLTV